MSFKPRLKSEGEMDGNAPITTVVTNVLEE